MSLDKYIQKLCTAVHWRRRAKKIISVDSLGKKLYKQTISSVLDDFVRYKGQIIGEFIDSLVEKAKEINAKAGKEMQKAYEFLEDYFKPKKPEEERAYA